MAVLSPEVANTGTAGADARPLDSVAARLNEPQVATSLNTVLDHADLLALLVVALDGFFARGDVIGQALADSVQELRGAAAAANSPLAGVDTQALLHSLLAVSKSLPKATPALTRAFDSGVLDRVLDSEVLSPEVLAQITVLARGLKAGANQAATAPIQVHGALGLVKHLKDPEISRALGFFLSVLKGIGADLGARPATGH